MQLLPGPWLVKHSGKHCGTGMPDNLQATSSLCRQSSQLMQWSLSCRSAQIPTKIEVFVGPDAADATANMRRLGYLSFDSNERSNHQARELKSVHVSVEAQLVRLLIHRCHVNKLNIYNQVLPQPYPTTSSSTFQPFMPELSGPAAEANLSLRPSSWYWLDS